MSPTPKRPPPQPEQPRESLPGPGQGVPASQWVVEVPFDSAEYLDRDAPSYDESEGEGQDGGKSAAGKPAADDGPAGR